MLLAIAVLLAGCAGGQVGTTTTPATGDAATTAAGTTGEDATTDATTDSTEGRSAVNFYVSDERNAMGDFEHLNVTVSKVGFKPAGGGDAGWKTNEVDERTVDLTRLVGPNATRLGTFAVENGTYETVFVHVSEVNGTLANGETVRVKLPSEKLQIHQTFEVGPNETVDYVFDISVFEAGKSGKYILKPVISESGTDKPIESVDGEREDETDAEENGDDDETNGDETGDEKTDDGETDDEKTDDEETGEDDHRGDDETDDGEREADAELNASFVGDVTRGGNATLAVTRNGSAVANATVEVGGEVVGETDADGRLVFSVPDEAELEVEVETDDGSVELKKRFEEAAETTTAA